MSVKKLMSYGKKLTFLHVQYMRLLRGTVRACMLTMLSNDGRVVLSRSVLK